MAITPATRALRGVSRTLIAEPPGTDLRAGAIAHEVAHEVRQKCAAYRVDDSDQNGGNESAADRTNAADDDDHEGQNQDVLAHPDLHEGERRLHHSGKSG